MNRFRKLGGLLFSLTLLGLSLLAWSERQAIYDWYRLRGYDPPKQVVQLAGDTTMNDYARKVFYVNHPLLEDKAGFNQHCPQTEQTIVLGCYVKNGGIYIYDVSDPRLKGVEQVTAAHELLHAAYDRLNESEKSNVIGLIKKAYAEVNNKRIRKSIASYQKAGADINDELHSILGTEVRDLPAELETYYQKYFENRVKIVGYSEAYEQVFNANQAKISRLEGQINSLKSELNSLKSFIDSRQTKVAADYQRLQQLADSGQTKAYNKQVPIYNGEVSKLRAAITSFNQKVELINDLIKQYNQLGVEQSELYEALDSHVKSPPQ